MPSGLSQVEIVNKALILIGDQTITAMSQNAPRAILMNALWAGTRDNLLRECPWNFATKRTGLAASVTAPEYEWTAAFPLPDDFLYMVSTEGNSPYRMEGNNILSNQASALKITYVAQITVVTEFDSGFANAMSYKLAYEGSARLSQDTTTQQILKRDSEKAVIDAKRLDGQEDDPKSYAVDSWLTARQVGTDGDVSREPH